MGEYNFAFLDEGSKKRNQARHFDKVVAIPGYQVPFASGTAHRKGLGDRGLQLTLSLIGKSDCLKVMDQGHDDSVNAVSLSKPRGGLHRHFHDRRSRKATVIQTRHRIPEIPLREIKYLVLQVPLPEPLRRVETRRETKRMHAELDDSSMWLRLYEDIVRWGKDYDWSGLSEHGKRPVCV